MIISRERLRSLAAWVLVKAMAALCGIGIAADSTIVRSLVGWLVRLTVSSGTQSYPVIYQCSIPLGICVTFTFDFCNHHSFDLCTSILATRYTFTVLIGPTLWSQPNSRIVLLRSRAA